MECPYCDGELDLYDFRTAHYGTLHYGICNGCRQVFVRYHNEDEWEESAENWFYDDYMEYDDCFDFDGAFRE